LVTAIVAVVPTGAVAAAAMAVARETLTAVVLLLVAPLSAAARQVGLTLSDTVVV